MVYILNGQTPESFISKELDLGNSGPSVPICTIPDVLCIVPHRQAHRAQLTIDFPYLCVKSRLLSTSNCSWYDPGMTMFHQLPQPGGKPLMSLPRMLYTQHRHFPRVEGGLACPLLDRPMDIRLDVQSPDKPPQAPGTGNCSRRRHCWSMLGIWGNRRPWTVLVRYQRTLGLTIQSCPRDCRHESPYTMFFVGGVQTDSV